MCSSVMLMGSKTKWGRVWLSRLLTFVSDCSAPLLPSPCHSSLHSHSYISRGLLASPLLTALDLSGSSTFTSRTLHALTAPLYDLASLSLITAASLADYPVRALVLRPVGLLPSLVSRMGPLGAWAGQLTLQLQRLVPGVVDAGDGHGVPPQGWVEVLPSGAVLDDKTGWRMWHLVDGNAARATAA